MILLNTNMGYF